MSWVAALQEHEEAREAIDKIHGDDDESDRPLQPSLCQDAEQGDRKRRVAQSARHDSKDLADLGEEPNRNKIHRVLYGNGFNLSAQSSICCRSRDPCISLQTRLLLSASTSICWVVIERT
jgi:hypothetical protein